MKTLNLKDFAIAVAEGRTSGNVDPAFIIDGD